MPSKEIYILGATVVGTIIIITTGIYFFWNSLNASIARPEENSANAPSVSYNVKNGFLIVRWKNLPEETKILNVYKTDKNSTGWSFVSSLPVPNGTQKKGGIGISDKKKFDSEDRLLFRANNGEGLGNELENNIWQSQPPPPLLNEEPPNVSSDGNGSTENTASSENSGNNNSTSGSSSNSDTGSGSGSDSGSGSGSDTGSGSDSGSGSSSSSDTGSGSDSGSGSGSDSGSGSGSDTGSGSDSGSGSSQTPPSIPSFQVSNSPSWIELTWQNLPSDTDFIVFSRTSDLNSPWSTFYAEPNPNTVGPYTVTVTIDTPNIPFYYQLAAYKGSDIIDVYGPVYLSALQQP